MHSNNFTRLLLVSACLLTIPPSVFAANGYSLEEVTPVVSPTPHGSIIKSEIDAVTGELTSHQYKINATYESASTTNYNYYKWGGTSLTTGTDTDYDVKIGTDTIHTNLDDGLTGDVVDKNFINLTSSRRGAAFYNSTSTAGYNITANFIGNYFNKDHSSSIQGGAFWNSKILGDVTGDFLGNYITNTNTGSAWGGAMYNEGIVTKIAGDFVGNYTETKKSGSSVGGAIFNGNGKIQLIEGDFINNYSTSNTGFAYGGAIYSNGVNAELTTITGNFRDNHVSTNATSNGAQGGAIHNTKIIGTLNGDFIGNYALSPNNQATGGAIANYVNGKITSITGDFIGNYVSGKNSPAGGAIYNVDLIGSLNGNFENNYAIGEANNTRGGALYNSASTGNITTLTGNFTNNYVSTNSAYAQGGAVYNDTKLTTIVGNFTGNHAETVSGFVRGGAIYNNITGSTGVINSITGDFIENYAVSESGNAKGGAIYNVGQIANITGTFTGNYAKSETGLAQGGAIFNEGTIGLKDVTFTAVTDTERNNGILNDIYNVGTINVSSENGTNSFETDIYNAGNINFTGDNTLNSNVTGTGNITISDATLTITGGSLTTGDSNASLTINSDAVIDIQGGTVTLDGGDAYDKVTWDGQVELNGGNLILSHIVDTTRTDSTHPTANKTGSLIANTGTLTIDSTSVLLGNGDVIADDVVLNLTGNLQIGKDTSDSADVTIDGANDTWTSGNITLANGGNLTIENIETNADKSLQANGGNLIIDGTTILNNANDIIAKEVATTINGTLNIQNGSVTLDSNDSGNGTINNDKDLGLILAGGTLTNTITGNGTTEIQGDVVNNDSISQHIVNITSGSLETNADNISASILNNTGTTISLTGGTNNNTIEGDGTTEIVNTVTNNATIAQESLKITNNSEFKTALNLVEVNQVINDGKLNITSGNELGLEVNGSGEILLNSGNMLFNSDIIGNTVVQNSLGTLTFANSATNIANANLQLNANNASINLADGSYNELVTQNLILNASNINISVDSSLADGIMDTLNVAGFTNNTNGTITINPNLPTNITEALSNDNIVLNPISSSVSASVKNELASAIQMELPNKIVSPVYQYTPTYDPTTGLLTVGIAATGGNNNYRSYNPAAFSSAVAAQTGGYFTMLNAYDQAFNNMDMRMNLTLEERRVMKMRNRYAYDGANLRTFSPNQIAEENAGGWIRPYASFERVNFRNGPNVNNVMYGTFLGGDSDIIELKNGWDFVYSGYAAYNGSHQTYDGISVYQNGGQIGGTAVWYKDNFFTGLTLSTGASVAQASSMYGNEDITMLMAGIASKTGYNWELAKGKFIIQPNWLMSYTFVNTFDYTNAAGVRMDSSPLHAIQLAPGVRFIGNLPHGWQPYLGVQMVWNIMDDTRINAGEVSLPQLSTKPYVQYGVGVQKRWGERCTGFFQTMLRNGGRTGVALSLGFRMTFGKGSNNEKTSKSSSPKPKKASLNLNNIK